MIKKLFITFYFLLSTFYLFSQDKRGNTIIYGGSADYARFNNDTSKPTTGHYFPFTPIKIFSNGSSNICDSATGKMVLISNGYVLYDSISNIIDNGDSLVPKNIYALNNLPSSGITQGSLILPKGSNGLYYIFTPTITDSMFTYWNSNPFGDGRFPFDLIQYHVVDMTANGGMGKVIQKNVPLLKNVELCKTGMMACKHANGYDWWLLKQGLDSNTIYTFLVTKDTVTLDTIQRFSTPLFGYYDLAGQSCFNHSGSKYAFASGGVNSNGAKLFMADFDRCYGILSNVKEVNVPYNNFNCYFDTLYPGEKDTLIRGICFSPNDSFLYISKSFNLYQYEHTLPDSLLAWYNVKNGIDTTFLQFVEYGQLALAPDNRIYIGKRDGSGNSNSVINYPNIKGVGCDFCRKCLRCDTCDYTQSFANMPNFNMPKKEPCYPMYTGQLYTNHGWSAYPNPSNTIIYIKNQDKKSKELYNSIGRLILTTIENEIDVSNYSKGIYYLRCGIQTKKIIIE